jgi:hypothetical protein
VATPAVKQLGFKTAIIISFWGYTIQMATLFFAILLPDVAWYFNQCIISNSPYYILRSFLFECMFYFKGL